MANLLDLMSKDDKEKSLSAFERRMAGDTGYRKDHKISPVSFLVAEFGYYYGWGAVEAVKREYILGKHDDGSMHKIPLTLEEVSEYVEAARKVWYGKVVDSSRGSQIAVGSVLSKNPNSTFDKGMKPFVKGAKL